MKDKVMPVFKKVHSPSLKDLFVQQIIEMILSGELEIGSKLPPERILAAEMGISRTVVNIGVSDLAEKGFVEIRPRIGNYIADYRRCGNMATLTAIMEYKGSDLNLDEYRSFLEMRELLAMRAFEVLSRCEGVVDLSGLKSLLAVISDENGPEALISSVFEFYHEVAVLSGNTIIPLVYNSFRTPVMTIYRSLYEAEGPSRFKSRAALFLELLEAGDVKGISQALREDTEHILSFLEEKRSLS